MTGLGGILALAGAMLVVYTLASVPLGYLAVRWTTHSVDIRAFGTGNPGTSNMVRSGLPIVGMLVGVTQFFEGYIIPAAGDRFGGMSVAGPFAMAVLVGNMWPIYGRDLGGRGVAVASGAVAALSPPGFLLLLAWYCAGTVLDEIAACVGVGFWSVPITLAVLGRGPVFWWCLGLALLISIRRFSGIRSDARAW